MSTQDKKRRDEAKTNPQGATLYGARVAAEGGAARVSEALRHNLRAARHNLRAGQANAHLSQGEARINQLGAQYGKQSDPLLGGRVTEEAHAATFNARAAMQGRPDLRAHTTESQGRPHDAADLEVLKGGQVVERAQLKVYKSGEATAKAQSAPKYAGQQKVVPSDQVGEVRATAQRQALRNQATRPAQARSYQDTAERATAQLEHDGVKSRPMSQEASQRLAQRARQGEATLGRIAPVQTQGLLAEVGKAAGQGALQGGAMGAGFTAVTTGVGQAYRCARGEVSGKEALKATGGAALKAGAMGAAKGAAGAALKTGATALAKQGTHSAFKGAVGTLARGNVAVAVGSVAVDGAVGVYKYMNGEITGKELGVQVAASSASAAGGAAGMWGGAALGTMIFPGVGTVIGGFLGGLFGGMGSGAVTRKLLK